METEIIKIADYGEWYNPRGQQLITSKAAKKMAKALDLDNKYVLENESIGYPVYCGHPDDPIYTSHIDTTVYGRVTQISAGLYGIYIVIKWYDNADQYRDGTYQLSPRWTMRYHYFKDLFIPERMLSVGLTHKPNKITRKPIYVTALVNKDVAV